MIFLCESQTSKTCIFTDVRITAYTYPEVNIPTERVSGNSWSIVTLAPKEGLCKTKDAKDCTNECTRCQNSCFYNMELHRSGSPCNDEGIDYSRLLI